MRIFCVYICFLIGLAGTAYSSPIYVYKGKGGVVHFSSKPPPQGVKTEVFTAKGKKFSTFYTSWAGREALFHGRYNDLISEAGQQHKLDPALLRAVIHAESAFNPTAVSPKGALGLMQLMPGTARQYGVKEPFDPNQNIKAGTRHLASLLQKFRGNLAYTLAAYNAGEEAVLKYRGIPPYSETQEYVRRVLLLKRRYAG